MKTTIQRLAPKFVLAQTALAAGAMACCLPAAALDYQGYFRALAGSNSSHGGASCFQLAGAL